MLAFSRRAAACSNNQVQRALSLMIGGTAVSEPGKIGSIWQIEPI